MALVIALPQGVVRATSGEVAVSWHKWSRKCRHSVGNSCSLPRISYSGQPMAGRMGAVLVMAVGWCGLTDWLSVTMKRSNPVIHSVWGYPGQPSSRASRRSLSGKHPLALNSQISFHFSRPCWFQKTLENALLGPGY
jgi:hypothetical protein